MKSGGPVLVLACAVWAAVFSAAALSAADSPSPRAEVTEALVTNQTGDSLSFVDLGQLKAVAEIKIGGKPAGIALSPDKALAYLTAPESKELVTVSAEKREIVRRLKV